MEDIKTMFIGVQVCTFLYNYTYCHYANDLHLHGNCAPLEAITFHYRGRPILLALREHLMQNGMNKSTDVILTGCSGRPLISWFNIFNVLLWSSWWSGYIPPCWLGVFSATRGCQLQGHVRWRVNYDSLIMQKYLSLCNIIQIFPEYSKPGWCYALWILHEKWYVFN